MVTTHKMDIFITEVDLWSTDNWLELLLLIILWRWLLWKYLMKWPKRSTFAPTIVIAEKTNTNTFKE